MSSGFVPPTEANGCFRPGERQKAISQLLRVSSARRERELEFLYHARHAFGTYAMAETKNPALVRDVMGHADLRTTMIYQHPDLEPLRDAIDHRNQRVM
jgi:site-specific recombinase XerD